MPNESLNLQPQFDQNSLESVEPLKLLAEETPEEYFARVRVFLWEKAPSIAPQAELGFNIFQDYKCSAYFAKCLSYLSENENSIQMDKKFSDVKNAETLKDVKEYFNFTRQSPKETETGTSYIHTNVNRSFYGPASSMGIPYAQSLFCVSGEKKQIGAYISGKLAGKNIALFGGGRSVNDLITDPDFKPERLVNIDPYIPEEPIEKGKNYPYMSAPIEAQDSVGLKDFMTRNNIRPFDEIWASNSVPMYLYYPEQVIGLFTSLKESLAEGGTARITPIKMRDIGSNDGRNEFLSQVKALSDSPDFNIYLSGDGKHGTLFIRKLKK